MNYCLHLFSNEELPMIKCIWRIRFHVVAGIVFCAIALPELQAFAFVPEDLERLKSTNNCPGCDLRSADLHGARLKQAVLEGANLMGANLEGADLQGAVLDDASLEKAVLKKAILSGASLDHATIDDADLNGALLDDTIWVDGKICKKGSVGVCKK
jgi:uncharacterized protein YjbI with pentapeptide repeats